MAAAQPSRPDRHPLVVHRTSGPGAKDPQELLDPVRFESQDAVEGHLLEIFLPTVYAAAPGIRHRPGAAERWLQCMAALLHYDRTVNFGWMQVRSVVPAVLSMLLFGGVLGWFTYLVSGLRAAEAVMAFAILASFLHPSLGFESMKDPDDVYADLRSALRQRRLADSLVSTTIGCVAMLGVAYWLSGPVGVASWVAWGYGITLGLGIGGAILLGTSWGIYKASHAWYWLLGGLPWRLTAFLDEAHRLGVLRVAGPAYQFRHVRLLEQLSGDTGGPGPDGESKPEEARPAARERRKPWRGRFFRGLLVTGWILLLSLEIAFVVTDVRGDALSYRSGDKPVMYAPTCNVEADPNGGATETCIDTHPLIWKLRAGSTMRTVLGQPTYQYAVASGTSRGIIQALTGELSTSGCAQASVQVAIIVAGLHLKPFVMGVEHMPAEALAQLAREPEGKPLVEITLRRLDTRPCTLSFTWANPWISYDLYGNIRQRLPFGSLR